MILAARSLVDALAALVAVYSLTTGALALPQSLHPDRSVVAMALFAVCFALSLLLARRRDMPPWLAGLNVGASFAAALLCATSIPNPNDAGDLHWYVGATGCLLVVTALRRQAAFAWLGIGMVAAQTLVWAGLPGMWQANVPVVALWIAVTFFGTRALDRAMRDVQQFARAEREAVEWQAAQEAHHSERQVRLTQTSRVALPMLRHILATGGELDEPARQECRVLEQTIRDEIRGRRLLNAAVRDQVIAARRRGAFVQVLDDGGLDDLEASAMEPVLDRVAEAIAGVRSDRIIIRTAPKGSDKAVTVVGISIDPTAAALGLEDEGEEVDLWLELDRPEPARV
ncbi:hypothetical protein [Amnibacterium endophyticum]|uniref:Histidine kinase n=1 Tax=Amnibacterium endophyticum TaxID=2109337 RepID=A0ABW4LDR7_9MICO